MSVPRPLTHSPSGFGWRDAQVGAKVFSSGGSLTRLLGGGVAAADMACILSASAIAYVARHGWAAPSYEVALITLLAAALAFKAIRVTGGYGRYIAAPFMFQAVRMARGWTFVVGALLIVAYLTKTSDDFSRAWASGWFLGALTGMACVRGVAVSRVRRWRRLGKLARTVAIVDLDGRGDALARQLQAGSHGEMRLLGVFSGKAGGARKSGVDNLAELALLFRVDEVVVSVSGGAEQEIDALMIRLGAIPTNVRLSPRLPPMAVSPRSATLLFGQPMLTISCQPLPDLARVAKRAEDLVLSAVGLVLIAPFMAAVAVLVKLDSPGPALFRQPRLGFNNNVITVYKFRTMVQHEPAGGEVTQARRQDPRVTRVGWFLRRSSIDELPQLFNVLKGEMSLVGPRPHALAHNEQYAALIDGYLGRHRVQPGITGWAQVHGLRGETDTLDKMQRRVKYDLEYTDNWSLVLDFRIIVMTVFTTLFDRNAY